MRTLIVEDAPRMRRYLSQALKGAGYAVDTASDGAEGLALAELNDYDVVLLDVMLPRMNGLSVLESLRGANRDVSVLILSARDTLEDRVRGLQQGADDYLVKPFALAELLARLQALVRRRYGCSSAILQIADLTIDTGRCAVTKNERFLALRPREYALLEYLAMRKGRVVSRSDIEHHVYDEHADLISKTVPRGYPEPGLFQQSLGWIDKEGNGVRYDMIYSNMYHGMGLYPRPTSGGAVVGGGGAGAGAAAPAGTP